jgi:hypothetical protein
MEAALFTVEFLAKSALKSRRPTTRARDASPAAPRRNGLNDAMRALLTLASQLAK